MYLIEPWPSGQHSFTDVSLPKFWQSLFDPAVVDGLSDHLVRQFHSGGNANISQHSFTDVSFPKFWAESI
jgi:hypothetical protein